MKKIKVIEVTAILNIGGAETFLVNVLENINRDKFNIDFLCYGNEKFDYEDKIEKLGSKIYRIDIPTVVGMKTHIKQLIKFFKENKYDVVHCHNLFNCGPVMLAAFLSGVKIRISHSHTTKYLDETKISLKKHIYYFMAKVLLNIFSTKKISCSYQSGKFLYYGKFTVINNGIDLKKFIYSEKNREDIRNMYKIGLNEKVIGHVGRFVDVKNHKYLINLLKIINDSCYDVKMLLVGDGPNMIKIKKMVKENNLQEKVIFAGNALDSFKYYSAMDVLVFPSLYEGIPLTLIEAQTNGLYIIASDRIDKKVKITNNFLFFDLNQNIKETANTVIKYLTKSNHNVDFKSINNSDYSIETTVSKLEKIYSREEK